MQATRAHIISRQLDMLEIRKRLETLTNNLIIDGLPNVALAVSQVLVAMQGPRRLLYDALAATDTPCKGGQS